MLDGFRFQQQTTNNKQQTINNKQQTTNNKQQTTNVLKPLHIRARIRMKMMKKVRSRFRSPRSFSL